MSDVSTFLLFLRVAFSLAVVLGMIWGAARFAKRRGKIAHKPGEASVEIVARKQLGKRGSLLVVESGHRTFLVGVTDSHIGLVADLSDPTAARPIDTDAVADAATFVSSIPLDEIRLADATAHAATAHAATADRTQVPVDLTAEDGRVAHPKRESLVDALRDLTVRR